MPYTVRDNGGAGGLELVERRRHNGRMELWMALWLICVCLACMREQLERLHGLF